MSRPDDDALLEFASQELPDGVFQQQADTRAVPPPVHNEIDGLVDAISAGGRPRLFGGSDEIAEANDSGLADFAVADRVLPHAPALLHTTAFRYVVCSIVAFAVGTVIAWSVLKRFETPSASVAVHQPVVSTPSPIAAPAPVVPPASIPARSAAAPTAPIVERAPRAVAEAIATSTAPARDAGSSLPVAPTTVAPLPDVPPREGVDLESVASLAPPAAIAPPPAAPAPAPAAPVVSAAALEQNAVLETLREYARAYQALDVKATAAVWPSVDRRALTRAFSTLKSHQLELEDCRVTIADASALSQCRGIVEYVRKVGSSTPRTAHQELVFKMRKLGSDWFIDEVSASDLTLAQR
jgi:hypothetical protein